MIGHLVRAMLVFLIVVAAILLALGILGVVAGALAAAGVSGAWR